MNVGYGKVVEGTPELLLTDMLPEICHVAM
jgi:hypothetical protein